MEHDAPFELVVIGGGPGGYVAAIRAAQLGMSTVLVEKDSLGGVCLNWGCIPTKALLHAAGVVRSLRHAATFGVRAQLEGVDLDAMVQRSRAVADRLGRGVGGLLQRHRVKVLRGHGRLCGAGVVEVASAAATQRLFARHVLLATGARARALSFLAPLGDALWSYREALVPQTVPRSMVVIGAGAIGVEFACFYATLGCQVTLVESAASILPTEDSEVATFAAQEFEGMGIDVRAATQVVSAARTERGCVLELRTADGALHEITSDVVLAAVGIVGNVENLGLEHTRVQVEGTHIVTDGRCATAEPSVYAIGDVAGPPWLAHKASHEAVGCVERLAGLDTPALDAANVPSCVFGYPQVASIGLTEAKARKAGRAIRVGRFPFAASGMAIAAGHDKGFVKTIVDAGTGEILGAHLVGDGVAELVHSFALARAWEATSDELMHVIYPHPTLSEAVHESILSSMGHALHV